jgi:hypothetical protein
MMDGVVLPPLGSGMVAPGRELLTITPFAKLWQSNGASLELGGTDVHVE